jgi:excisionase family DNA binding protein
MNLDLVNDGTMTIPQAEDFSNLKRSKLYQLMEAGELAYVKIGKARRIPRRALVELLAGHIQGGWAAGPRQIGA